MRKNFGARIVAARARKEKEKIEKHYAVRKKIKKNRDNTVEFLAQNGTYKRIKQGLLE